MTASAVMAKSLNPSFASTLFAVLKHVINIAKKVNYGFLMISGRSEDN